MKKRILAILMVLVMALAILAGCAAGNDDSGTNGGNNTDNNGTDNSDNSNNDDDTDNDSGEFDWSNYHIGVSFGTISTMNSALIDAWQRLSNEKGFEATITSCDFDTAKQISDVESLVSLGCDVVAIQAPDLTSMDETISRVYNEEDCITVTFGTATNTNNYHASCMANDFTAGTTQGEWLVNLLGTTEPIKIGKINGKPGSAGANMRDEGYQDSIFIHDNYELVVECVANWKRDEALPFVEDWIRIYPDLDVILAHNDDMALAAVQAYTEAGLIDEIVILGTDGVTDDAKKAIKEGSYEMTALKSPDLMIEYLVESIQYLLEGNTYPEDEKDIFVPYIAVDKSNIDEFYSG